MLRITKKRNDLKPCPFCSGEAMVRRSEPRLMLSPKERFSVFCTVCRCETDYFETEKEAVINWNKRVKKLNEIEEGKYE